MIWSRLPASNLIHCFPVSIRKAGDIEMHLEGCCCSPNSHKQTFRYRPNRRCNLAPPAAACSQAPGPARTIVKAFLHRFHETRHQRSEVAAGAIAGKAHFHHRHSVPPIGSGDDVDIDIALVVPAAAPFGRVSCYPESGIAGRGRRRGSLARRSVRYRA